MKCPGAKCRLKELKWHETSGARQTISLGLLDTLARVHDRFKAKYPKPGLSRPNYAHVAPAGAIIEGILPSLSSVHDIITHKFKARDLACVVESKKYSSCDDIHVVCFPCIVCRYSLRLLSIQALHYLLNSLGNAAL